MAVCFLWHCPAGRPGWLLATTLPCGARTFLGESGSPVTRVLARRGRLADSSTGSGYAPHDPEAHTTLVQVGLDELDLDRLTEPGLPVGVSRDGRVGDLHEQVAA